MSYYSGFVLAVPADKRDEYADHATRAWPAFKRPGALRLVECWGEDVPHGKRTDFYRATEATGDEDIGLGRTNALRGHGNGLQPR